MKNRKIQKRKRMTRLEEFKVVCRKYMVIKDDEYIDVIFGTVYANLYLDSVPLWLWLVAPPGAGKTAILQSLSGSNKIYMLSSLTPHTFVSGMKTDKKTGDPSLLPKLDGQVVVFKDFTPMLQQRRETLSIIMGQLREIYDGSYRQAYGTGKQINYRSKIGIIAGVTNALDKHLRILAPLGERFLIYRCPKLSQKERRARASKATTNLETKKQRIILSKAANCVLDYEPEVIPQITEEQRKNIVAIADIVTRARTVVERDRYDRSPYYTPESEVPTRFAEQLCNLARGLAMVHKRDHVSENEINLIKKTALDCLSSNRRALLMVLTKEYPEGVTIKHVAEKLKIGFTTARLKLQDLSQLDLIKLQGHISQYRDVQYGSKDLIFVLKKSVAKVLKKLF